MITLKKALKIVLDRAHPLGVVEIELGESLGRVLAEKVYSDIDIPAFNRSAMDGFAIDSKDPSKIFKIIEDIPAGKIPKKRIKFGQCARIMTGAMLPKGADKVVKVENTKQLTSNSLRLTAYDKKSNVSTRGEDIRKGRRVLKKGRQIRPQEAAMLAAVGKTRIKVYRQPKAAIISTGSELVEPWKKPQSGQIRNSNSSMLLLQLKKLGIDGEYLGIARDNYFATKELIRKGLERADILILSGGVSVGDYDFVAAALSECGVKILFNKVAVQPGKPTTFGIKGQKYIFGLPGNPVSVFIAFELFAAPLINRIMNRESGDKFIKRTLLLNFKRKNADREQYYPVYWGRIGAIPIEFHGSGHLMALTYANGIMRVKKGVKQLNKGEQVHVRPI